MNVLIASDLQFSEQARLSHRLEDGITSRLRQQVECFDWIMRVGREHKCEKFFALGDIFDSRTSIPVPVIDQACRCFERASREFETTILVGNHDAALRHAAVNSLQAMRGLARVIEKPTVFDSFAFVPWVEDADDFRAAVAQVAKNKAARYLFSHVMIVGAVPADVGRALSDLRPERWKRVFLGDVHDPIKLERGVQYIGAPMQHHFGDAGGERGVWILNTKSGEATFVENTISPRFHKMTSKALLPDIRKRDFVRVSVEDPVKARAIAALAGKRTRWVESDAVQIEQSVKPRLVITLATSQRDIVSRYAKYRGVSNDTKRAVIECGMSILDEVTG